MSDPDRAAELVVIYARSGVRVFPLHTPQRGANRVNDHCSCGRPPAGDSACRNVGKHPRTRNGKDDATSDLTQVAEWLARWPDANWGIAVAPGYVVLDVDPRNGGDDSLADLEARHGDLPATLTCRTGSGGWHLWFTHDGPKRGRIGKGLDIKYEGGYLVAPPSEHLAGGTYEWVDESPPAVAPLWLRDKLAPPPRVTVDRPERNPGDRMRFLVDWVRQAGEGERNNRLYWAACRAREQGLDPGPLVAAAESVGTPFHEAARTVESSAHAAEREATDATRWRWRDRASA